MEYLHTLPHTLNHLWESSVTAMENCLIERITVERKLYVFGQGVIFFKHCSSEGIKSIDRGPTDLTNTQIVLYFYLACLHNKLWHFLWKKIHFLQKYFDCDFSSRGNKYQSFQSLS